ncbi:hypothetical protein [uncultured Corynebacterium sp.]|uniref:hypothetical protein n=1 Tax=uncultured Corynebacterium sp. TaxID=159447 RepID=UPI002621A383|nr:hypothetical protein [uncultured Corynebacterium sp.]
MSEEKLTVAELLARAEKRGEGATRSDRPRRRRRSLEDGGVSVAELTGSIPKVRADGPRRGAHAAPDELEETTAEAPEVEAAPEAPETAEAAAVEPEVADAPESELEAVADDEPVAEAEVTEVPEITEDPVLDEAADDELAAAEYVDEPVTDDAVLDEDVAAEPAVEEDLLEEDVAVEDAAEESRAPMAVPAAVPLDPRPVMSNEERGEVTYTFTKLHDADTGSWPVAEAGPVAREVLESSQAHDDRPTAVLPVIEEPSSETAPLVRPEPETADDVDEDDSIEDLRDGGYRSAGVEEWGAAGERDEADHWDTGAVPAAAAAAPAAAALSDGPEVDEYAARAREDEEYGRLREEELGREHRDLDVDESRDGATAASKESGPAKKKLRRTKKGQLEDDSLSIGLLVVQTVVGLILGALAFVVFNFLWSALPVAVCVVIALVFTFLLVVGVNMVRREKDGITPILAGIVGLVVSFAPWLLTMM